MKFIFRLIVIFLMLGLTSAGLTQETLAKPDDEEITLVKSKAEQGEVLAQLELALMYYGGDGIPQDYKKASYWFTKAAEQGNYLSQHSLGEMYLKGNGIPQDYKKASYWFTKAAENGFVPAQYNLGLMCFQGEGVLQNFIMSYVWFNLAASQGHELAKQGRDIVKEEMSQTQIEEGQKLSKEYYDKIYNQEK